MKYETAEAFRQALEQRLLDRSRKTSESLLWLRKAVVFDRLLARLLVVATGRWVLKGALALDFRLGERGRTTKDLDLVRRDDEESATADLLAAQVEDLGDFFVFGIERAGRPAEAEGGAVRYHVRAELGAGGGEGACLHPHVRSRIGQQPHEGSRGHAAREAVDGSAG